MNTLTEAFLQSFQLMITLDETLVEVVLLSLSVTFKAVSLACLIGFPLGTALAVLKFPGQKTLIVLFNSFMGLPPVVVGLVVYLILSANGPLGPLGLLYTPTAMIIAQTILVTPIIVAHARQIIVLLAEEYDETLRSMQASRMDIMGTLLWDSRFSLFTTVLAGLGRAFSEVGAVMIVGGNINHFTRIMTTAIALQTARGDLALALGLGIILLVLTISINALAYGLKTTWEKHSYA